MTVATSVTVTVGNSRCNGGRGPWPATQARISTGEERTQGAVKTAGEWSPARR